MRTRKDISAFPPHPISFIPDLNHSKCIA